MFIEQGHPTSKVIFYCKIASSTWYYHRKEKASSAPQKARGRPFSLYCQNVDGSISSDQKIILNLKKIREMKFFKNGGGYKKLSKYLRRDFGHIINHKKVYRLCSENGLTLPKKKKNKRRGKRISENREVTGPNQLWSFDIKYGYLWDENRFFFLMAFIDVFHREIVDYHIGLHCSADDIIFTLENGIRKKNISPENLVIRSDNGTQMTSHRFKKWIREHKVEHEFIPIKCPNKNAHIESFFSIIETELFSAHSFNNLLDAYTTTVEFISFYNNERIHGSLNYKTPKEYLDFYNRGKVCEAVKL